MTTRALQLPASRARRHTISKATVPGPGTHENLLVAVRAEPLSSAQASGATETLDQEVDRSVRFTTIRLSAHDVEVSARHSMTVVHETRRTATLDLAPPPTDTREHLV
jgi:hypothetical protein